MTDADLPEAAHSSQAAPSRDASPQLNARLDDLTATLNRVVADLDDLAQAVLPDDLSTSEALEPSVRAPVFATLEAWVADFFLLTFHRSIGSDTRWCRSWPDHPEAVLRLEALWRSWETLRLDPNLGIATWLTHHLDPQLGALTSRSGTFAACTEDRHSDKKS